MHRLGMGVTMGVRMIRKCAAAAAAALIIFLAAGCGTNSGSTTVDVQQVAKDLAENVTYAEPLTEFDTEGAERALHVDAADVAQACAYIGSGATVDEVSVWEAVDDTAAANIEQTLADRIAQRITDYADYKPEEVPKLQDAILERSGRYVVCCVTGDAQTAQDEITKALNL